jgi:acetolactate synthase I/II/III large subunit
MNTTDTTATETGGEAIVRALIENGIDRGFCVPGESYLGILNAFDTRKAAIDLVVCRHEGGASFMAEAYGRVTGRPGVCLVTRGPGSCNALIGLSTAMQESTPMILIIGHVSTGTAERFPFQGIDPKSVFSSVSKWVGVVERSSDIPYMIDRAIRISLAGRPGPVVLAVPDDVQMQNVPVAAIRPAARMTTAPSTAQIEQLRDMLSVSKKPLVILGGNLWTQKTSDKFKEFAEKNNLPVATTFRRNDLIDNNSDHYIGSFGPVPHPEMTKYANESDLILLLGGRLSEIETARYTQLCKNDPARKFIQAGALDDEFGEVLVPDLAITTDMEALGEMLAELPRRNKTPWADDRQRIRESYAKYRRPVDFGDLRNPGIAVAALSKALPDDVIVCGGAGNYTHFFLRHHNYKATGTLLAPLSGPMGYSIPSAISAAMARPGSETLAYVGDGCFFMNPQELVIAVKRKLPVTVVMFNNGIYGSIRMHQELNPAGRVVATTLDNPDFQVFAKSFGIPSVQLTDPSEVVSARETLRAKTKGPIFIELVTDPEVITTQRTLTQIRKK